MIPLNLTPMRQSALAAMAQLAATTRHQLDTPLGDVDYAAVGEKFCELLDRFDLTSQEWGEVYDKLHRTGSNS
jgi:hypothetical protein